MTSPNDVAALVERGADAMEALVHVAGTLGREGDKDSEDTIKGLADILAAAIAALQAEVERAKEDGARLDWLECSRNAELAHEGWEDDVWQVHTVNGGRNDREWTLRAEGQTVREAIDAARSASRKENTP